MAGNLDGIFNSAIAVVGGKSRGEQIVKPSLNSLKTAKQNSAASGIGLLLSGIMAPLISSLLYGVRPIDPEVFIAVPLILMVVVLLATYIPARRAARVSPIVALRES
jgi:ABC-type lipoprotein release transport system permease subunit